MKERLKASVRTYDQMFEQGILPKKPGDWSWLKNSYFSEIPSNLKVDGMTPKGTRVYVADKFISGSRDKEGLIVRHKFNCVEVAVDEQVIPLFYDCVAIYEKTVDNDAPPKSPRKSVAKKTIVSKGIKPTRKQTKAVKAKTEKLAGKSIKLKKTK